MAASKAGNIGCWPNGARAAVAFTMDNMGEAADLNRKVWPDSTPVGQHYSVTTVLPKMLSRLEKYDILATYFVESWNIDVYGDFILDQLAAKGHEVAWHAWQHEAWAKLEDEDDERSNFERSFGLRGIGRWLADGKLEPYSGFRPPGGIINGERTLNMCREYGLTYLSPAAEQAARVPVGSQGDHLTILPCKWSTVDAYFYMETFAGLRKMKGEYSEEPQSAQALVQRYTSEIDRAIEMGGFVSVLFHPFLTNNADRLEAMESVLKYMDQKRREGAIWLARCKDVDCFIREHTDIVGSDPKWDVSSWR